MTIRFWHCKKPPLLSTPFSSMIVPKRKSYMKTPKFPYLDDKEKSIDVCMPTYKKWTQRCQCAMYVTLIVSKEKEKILKAHAWKVKNI